MSSPHQARIRELFVSAEMAAALGQIAARLPGWDLNPQQMRELDLLMNGGFFPLKGYLTQADYLAVQEGLHLASGSFWPLPVTLEVDADFAALIEVGSDIALRADDGGLLAVMSVTDKWPADAGSVHLGGPVKGLAPSRLAGPSPNALRAQSRDKGWQRLVFVADGASCSAPDLPRLALDLSIGDRISGGGAAGQAALTQAILARNFGATDIVLDEAAARHPLVLRHQAGIGIAIHAGECG